MTVVRESGPAPSRRKPPAKPRPQVRSLDITEILRVVRKLVEAEGFEALSMRSLARELGVSPMAAYHHVGSKEELLALLVDDVLAPIEVPPVEFGDWEQRLRELSRENAEAMESCRGIEHIIFGMRPTREGWRLIDAYIQILLDGGFTGDQAALGFSVIHAYGMGRAGMTYGLRSVGKEKMLPPTSALALTSINASWQSLHSPDYREFADDVMFTGLRAILERGQQAGAPVSSTSKPVRSSASAKTTRPASRP